jgi:hypothetical protein
MKRGGGSRNLADFVEARTDPGVCSYVIFLGDRPLLRISTTARAVRQIRALSACPLRPSGATIEPCCAA